MNIYHVTAFYKELHGGNKAGVILFADGLSDTQMLKISKRLGYSESAFVSSSNEADFEVRFFTPTSEVDLCGHATIATFNVLRDEGVIKPGLYTQKTRAGILKLQVNETDVYMQQVSPTFYQTLSEDVLSGLFHNKIQFDQRYPIEVVSTGMKEIFLPVKDEQALQALDPKFDALTEYCKQIKVIGIHAFYIDDNDEIDAVSRNFAPVVGINEESATGTSNGALACYLYKHHEQKESYKMLQGLTMNQPSELFIELTINDQIITDVWVGGKANILQVEKETEVDYGNSSHNSR